MLHQDGAEAASGAQMLVTSHPRESYESIATPAEFLQLSRQIEQSRDWSHSKWRRFLNDQAHIKAWLKAATNDEEFGHTLTWGLRQVCPKLFGYNNCKAHSDEHPEGNEVVRAQTLTDAE
jgi:hypothetical protein